VSILRCLYIDNDTRNPKVKFVNEFVNNVVCDWETIGYMLLRILCAQVLTLVLCK
jgi:hypothetical protein